MRSEKQKFFHSSYQNADSVISYQCMSFMAIYTHPTCIALVAASVRFVTPNLFST